MSPFAALILVVPCRGATVTVTLDGTSAVPGFPAASLTNVLSVTGVLILVVAISTLATGGLVLIKAANTVITNLVGGHGAAWPGTHTGTSYV